MKVFSTSLLVLTSNILTTNFEGHKNLKLTHRSKSDEIMCGHFRSSGINSQCLRLDEGPYPVNIEIEEKNPTKEHERADIGMGFLLIEIDFFPLVEKLLTLKSCSHHELLKKKCLGVACG
jgi:hypothetical protein